jgi:hypothetical protein
MSLYTIFFNVIVLSVVICCTWQLYKSYKEVLWVQSDIDQRHYIIRNKYSNEKLKESANLLASINIRTQTLIDHVSIKYARDPFFSRAVDTLKKVYSPDIISEAANDARYTTFTIDKKDMHICLRTRDDLQNAYDVNLLMYVVIHELAHMANYDDKYQPILGHGKEFQTIFKLLVKEAMAIGVYSYQDYNSQPQEYCGIQIQSNIV